MGEKNMKIKQYLVGGCLVGAYILGCLGCGSAVETIKPEGKGEVCKTIGWKNQHEIVLEKRRSLHLAHRWSSGFQPAHDCRPYSTDHVQRAEPILAL